MRRSLEVLGAILLLAGLLVAQQQGTQGVSSTEADEAISAVLHAQVAAWNKGDLKGFMNGYWNSPDLVFASGEQETRGWEPVYNRYRVKYQTGQAEMGKLTM